MDEYKVKNNLNCLKVILILNAKIETIREVLNTLKKETGTEYQNILDELTSAIELDDQLKVVSLINEIEDGINCDNLVSTKIKLMELQ